MLEHETGVLAATTAFGKTVVAAWLIAQRGVNTLVLVHRRQLLDQWVERLSTFLNINNREIGRIGGGRRKPTGRLDVAVIQSLVRKGVVEDCIGEYGHVIVDECHHLSAHSFEQVVRRAKARFVTGLSATVTRKDGHHPIIFMQCGPVRHRVSAKAEAMRRPFTHSVLVRPTAFQPAMPPPSDKRVEFHSLYGELIGDESRNRRICEDVIEAVQARPIAARAHGKKRTSGQPRRSIGGKSSSRDRAPRRHGKETARSHCRRTCRNFHRTEDGSFSRPAVTLAKDSMMRGWTRLFLTLPVSWHGTIAQYAGRLHRLYDGKREVRIYDYADLNVPMLARMFDRRCRGYEAVGYSISLPASAVPGWPADVLLPSDPEWKRDYAATVRRLIRDGVDTPLANLFVRAAKPSSPEVDGCGKSAQRERSVSISPS